MIDLPTIEEPELVNKRVLVRVDFNTPLDKVTGEISDNSRLTKSIQSLRYLSDQGARIVLISHLGRPTEDSPKEFYSLKKCEVALKKLMP